MQVNVKKGQVERALRELKRKMIKEDVFKSLSRNSRYDKPSVKSRIKKEEAEKKRIKERKKRIKDIFFN